MRSISRRNLLRSLASSIAGISASGWMPLLAEELAGRSDKRRHCVLLWMSGGPSQTDTFDMKPQHPNGGSYQEIATNAPGVRFSEYLPKLATMAEQLAVIRSLSTSEGDHGRGTYLMRTGHSPGGPIQYPTLGSLISKELGEDDARLPNFVSITPSLNFNANAYQSGFLGPRYASLTVRTTLDAVPQPNAPFAALGVDDLAAPPEVENRHAVTRLGLLRSLQNDFVARHSGNVPLAHNTVVERALRMMHSQDAKAFDLSDEPPDKREAYGRGTFGQGCLMARRLIERGVPFVEVSLGGDGGWDTHRNNFEVVKDLSSELDAGWSSLMSDLKERGLLETTTIIWMGEFGRTPLINGGGGRDHYPAAWSAVLAGGGINGGQVYGRTSGDGTNVEDNQIDVGDLLVTLCHALGINPRRQNMSGVGRPIRVAEGRRIEELLV